MKLRIKHVEGLGWFAQTKLGFFTPWQKIGAHLDGLGLYREDNIKYPLATAAAAEARCELFKAWAESAKGKTTYKNI